MGFDASTAECSNGITLNANTPNEQLKKEKNQQQPH